MIWTKISDPRLFRSWYIKRTDESVSRVFLDKTNSSYRSRDRMKSLMQAANESRVTRTIQQACATKRKLPDDKTIVLIFCKPPVNSKGHNFNILKDLRL